MTNRITPPSRYPSDHNAAGEMARTDLGFCEAIKRIMYDDVAIPYTLIPRHVRARQMLEWLAEKYHYGEPSK